MEIQVSGLWNTLYILHHICHNMGGVPNSVTMLVLRGINALLTFDILPKGKTLLYFTHLD